MLCGVLPQSTCYAQLNWTSTVLGVGGPPEDSCQLRKRQNWRNCWEAVRADLRRNCWKWLFCYMTLSCWLPWWTWLFSLVELGTSLSPRMAIIYFEVTLMLIMSIASWLQRKRQGTAQSAREAGHFGFPDGSSAFFNLEGAWDLNVTEDGCINFQGSTGSYFEHHFLAAVQIPPPGSTEPSSHWQTLISTTDLRIFPPQIHEQAYVRLCHGWEALLQGGLMPRLIMESRPSAGLFGL